jgi:DNA-binding NtrC family response regulator
MPTILIIDDDPGMRTLMLRFFEDRKWSAAQAEDGQRGMALAAILSPDIILLDLMLPDGDGIDVMKQLKAQGCTASIVIMTGWGSIGNAVEAVKQGAEQYLSKPINLDDLENQLARILETQKLRIENTYYRDRMAHPVVGTSREVQRLHHLIDLMAENADTTTLLLGESGTGKELVAREIHHRSRRQERPFLDINCAVLSETLLESQMFGHERGAFTDAVELKRGLLEVAEGGTILLDEIGEMPQAVQPKLLRMLESRTFRRVGGTRDIPVNVRVIAATNRDLEKAVAEGRFREDLYYRLHVFPILLPPLRDRRQDIPVLAMHFLAHFNDTLKKNVRGFTPEAMELMTRYAWPGNVRELKNLVERILVLSAGPEIGPELLPPEIAGAWRTVAVRSDREERQERNRKTLNDVERDYILRVLREEGNNRSNAARVLGISRSTLHEKLKKYGITLSSDV